MDRPLAWFLWANVAVCFPLGPIAWVALGLTAVRLARRPGTRISPVITLKPSRGVRGLLACAAFVSVTLTVGFFLYFGSLSVSRGWEGLPFLVMLICDVLTAALFAVYVSVVRSLLAARDLPEPQVGAELWLALTTTLVGCIPPAVLAYSVWMAPRW